MRRDIFQAIADPTRRAIIALIALQAMTPNAIAENFNTTRQSVSKHLRILTECELVKQEQQGREIYYSLEIEKMKELDKWISQSESFGKPGLISWTKYYQRLKSRNNRSSLLCAVIQFLPGHTMQIEVFRTNVKTKKNADMIIHHIKRRLPAGRINFDLEDHDKILRIEATEIPVQPILNLLLDLGFTCIPLD